MDLHVSLVADGTDLTTQVCRQLRAAVRDGRLRPGERLPASRELAARLSVARGTVATAYERLIAEGFLTARVGSGTFVAVDALRSTRPGRRRDRGVIRPRSTWTFAPSPVSAQENPPFDFRVGVPDTRLFPFDTWRRLVASELRVGANNPGRYADPAGVPSLRAAIAAHIAVSRSVLCDPDDVLVSNGTQQALDLVCRVLLTPGDVVAVEEPGYPPAATLLESWGAHVVPVPVDDEGIVVDRIPRRARLVYTTPSHQFPLGVPMSLSRRSALVEWAERHGSVILEDDYDSEFRFTARPLEPLASLDRSGRVLYLGTFSKTMLPSLRMGFVVAPASLRSALRAARQLSDGYGPVATQAALARFIDDGLLARHVRRVSAAYARRHVAVHEALTSIGPEVEVVPSTAGLHLTARFRAADAGSSGRVVTVARRDGVAIDSLSGYCRGEALQGVVVGYGAVDPERIADGLELLVRAVRREVLREVTDS